VTFAEALEILGVSLPCNAKQAAKAFRKRALETHPDQGGDPQDFRRVTEALKVATLGLADAMEGRGPVHWDRKTGDLSWTSREVEGGVAISVEISARETDRMVRTGDAAALTQVLLEGSRRFRAANPSARPQKLLAGGGGDEGRPGDAEPRRRLVDGREEPIVDR
jgi:curved DNA-binding protein CbpA